MAATIQAHAQNKTREEDVFETLRQNAAARILAEKYLATVEAALHRPSLNPWRVELLSASMRVARQRLLLLREHRDQLVKARRHHAS